MSATRTTTIQSAMFADRTCGERVPSCQQAPMSHAAMADQTSTATSTTASMIETSVSALVSLFALVIFILRSLLLVVLLALSGLTGLVSLVGLITGLDASALQGD